MSEARQKDFLSIGREGCYFLSILHLAENSCGAYIDAWQAYAQALRTGLLGVDCFVNDAGALMSVLSSQKWTMSKEALEYVLQLGEEEITRYDEQVSPSQTLTHFVVTDGKGNVLYDPMGNWSGQSPTGVWKPASKRIFRRVA